MASNNPPLDRSGQMVVGIFGVLSLTAAVWTGNLIFPQLANVARLRNSVEVPAQVLDIDRQVVASGDGSTTITHVTYKYEFEGQPYERRTRTLTAFASNRNILPVLDSALATGESVPCHVDPDDPRRNLLSKEFSVPMLLLSLLFPIVFGGISMLVSWSLWKQFAEARVAPLGRRTER